MHDIGTRRDLHLPLLIAPPNQIAQLFLADIKIAYPHLFASSPFSRTFSSPPAVIVEGAVCESPHPFATSPPISLAPTKMANSLVEETKRIVAQFDYTDDDVNQGVQEFLRQMNEGLQKDGTSLSQIPTYVTGVPNGTEKGLYMAVDLGGTNFRVCSVHLNGDTTFNLTYSKVAIPKELMVAKTSKELFGFLAKQIELFLKKHHEEHFEAHVRRRKNSKVEGEYVDEEIFQLGFTFSFPVQQFGINKGSLIRWTKGFDIPDTIGKDVCALLQDEIDLLHLPVKVAALVNDTVGTLMARSYTAPGKTATLLGAIFGTGTNGAYVEKVTNLQKSVDGNYDKSTGEMVINTEWGSFDNQLNVLPNTQYDAKLDADSVNPGFQIFEKRVSGMFLGEIVRLAIVDLYEKPNFSLFKDVNSSTDNGKPATRVGDGSGLFQQWGLDSSLMSIAVADTTPDLSKLRQELNTQLQIRSASVEDAQAFKDISYAVGRRAARLSAVALGGIVLQSGRLKESKDEPVDIGADGSLVEFYPRFREMIQEALESVEGIGAEGARRIRIGIARDGSGVGAALIALVAANMEKKGIMDELAAFKNEAAQKLAGAIPSVGESTTLV
ncbi:glucokinase [Xylaria sp. FL0043]|nr:glucokinase [Xylaria sp. FL0043]